jgi:hypothetical protein
VATQTARGNEHRRRQSAIAELRKGQRHGTSVGIIECDHHSGRGIVRSSREQCDIGDQLPALNQIELLPEIIERKMQRSLSRRGTPGGNDVVVGKDDYPTLAERARSESGTATGQQHLKGPLQARPHRLSSARV